MFALIAIIGFALAIFAIISYSKYKKIDLDRDMHYAYKRRAKLLFVTSGIFLLVNSLYGIFLLIKFVITLLSPLIKINEKGLNLIGIVAIVIMLIRPREIPLKYLDVLFENIIPRKDIVIVIGWVSSSIALFSRRFLFVLYFFIVFLLNVLKYNGASIANERLGEYVELANYSLIIVLAFDKAVDATRNVITDYREKWKKEI